MSTALGGESTQGQSGATGTQGEGNSSGSGQSTSNQGQQTSNAGQSSAMGGEPPKTWRETLPEDIRDNPSLKVFSDVGNLAKSYLHAQSQIGKKGAIVPDWSKASDEEKSSFFKSIGVPELDKYELSVPKDYQIPEAVSKEFKELAAKNGLLPQQASALLGWYAQFEGKSVNSAKEAAKAQAQEGLANLKKEWGDAFDRELSQAKVAVKELGGDDFVNYLNKTGLGNDPTLIKIFSKAAKLMGEDKLREGGATEGGMTRAEIQAQLDEIRANGNINGLFDKNHPNRNATMMKYESLAKKLTGGR